MNCISCDNSSLIPYSDDSYMNLPVFNCKKCGLLITGNSEEEVRKKSEEIYKKEYWNERQSEKSIESDFTDLNSQDKKRQWASQYAYCKKYLDNKRDLLEIGSGAGQSLYWFEEIGFKVTGIEPDSRNVSLINQKLKQGKVIPGFAEDLEIQEEFDIIWISHVFEHLVRPDLALKKWRNNLRKNGILFIEVPNCENKIVLKSSVFDNPSTFHFSKKALSNLGTNTGYNVERCDYFRSPTIVEGALNRITKKYLRFMHVDLYPFYPKIITDDKNGVDLRIILKRNN